MARIPIYQDRLTPQGEQTQRAQPVEISGAVGAALQGLGQAGSVLAGQMARQQRIEEEQRDTLELGRSLSERVIFEQGQLQEINTRAVGGVFEDGNKVRHNSGDYYAAGFDARTAEYLSGLKTPRLRMIAEQGLLNLRTAMIGAGYRAQHDGVKAGSLESAETTIRNLETGVQGGLPLEVARTQINNVAANLPGIDSATRLRISNAGTQRLAAAAAGMETIANPAGMLAAFRAHFGGGVPGVGGAPGAAGDTGALSATAERLGVTAQDLATVIAYETGGTMSPSKRGGKNNQHIGLIQFGANEQAAYGANEQQSFQEQLGAVERYLKDRGLKPGDNLETLYRIINGGNRNVPLTASDGNGTIAQHVQRMQGGSADRARQFMATQGETAPAAQDGAPAVPIDPKLAHIVAMMDPDSRVRAMNAAKAAADGQFAAERQAINRDLPDQHAALRNGQPSNLVNRERMLAAGIPPAQVAEIMDGLAVSKTAGREIAASKWESPAGVAASRARLAATQGGGDARPPISPQDEAKFQALWKSDPAVVAWRAGFKKQYGEEPNINDAQYDYRAAILGGARPEPYKHDGGAYHWPSVLPNGKPLKSEAHPTAWMEKFMQVYGVDPHEATPEQLEDARKKGIGPGIGGPDPAKNFLRTQDILGAFDTVRAARDKQLNGPSSDPAAYVWDSPAMLGVRLTGGTTEQIAAMSWSEQRRMGALSPRVLTNAAAAGLAATIEKTPVADGGAIATLAKMEQDFGSQWQQVFSELVTKGGMPEEYKVLVGISPDHRPRYVGALAEMKASGGLDKLRARLPDNVGPRKVDAAVDTAFDAARKAFGSAGRAGAEFNETMQNAAKAMAYTDIIRSVEMTVAVRNATSAMLDRWEFFGTAMAPKGEGAAVRAAMRGTVASLTPENLDLSDLPVPPGLTKEAVGAAWMEAVRQGEWVPSPGVDGLKFMARAFNGARVLVRRNNEERTPVEFKFGNLPYFPDGGRIGGGSDGLPRVVSPTNMPTFDVAPR